LAPAPAAQIFAAALPASIVVDERQAELLHVLVIEVRSGNARAGEGVVFLFRHVLIKKTFETPDGLIIGIVGQMAFDGGDGFHAAVRQGELWLTNAAAQFIVQQQRQLPGREQNVVPLRIAGSVVRRIEDMLQLRRRLGELASVRVSDGAPVIDGWPHARLQPQHQIEQAMCLVELSGGWAWLQQERTGALQAQIEIDERQRLRIVGQLVEIERAMYVPEAIARQAVIRIKLQGAAERLQSAAIAADARVTEAAEGVLEDAQARQHFHRVAEIHQERKQERHGTVLHVIVGQNAKPETEAGAHDADLDLGFLFVAGEGQQIEERNAKEDLHGEDGSPLTPTPLPSGERGKG
jgi:hypothetical protein